MSDSPGPPIIRSKLEPHVRAESIARERLLRRLDRAAERPLTVIAAPAGFGKTTALAQWLERTGRRHAWLRLDESDNDPRWFAARLLASLQRTVPGGFMAAARALGGGSDLTATVVPLLVGDLPADPRGLVIALDDYHLIAEGECHRLLSDLVDSLPAPIAVVVSGRTVPPLRLGRRRAAGTVAELGPGELRFDLEECERLLNGMLGLALDRPQVQLIEERLQGWAAGLTLVAGAVAGRSDRAGFLEALDRSRADLDIYLTEEVLDAASPELADFLRRTSILDELSADLCAAVAEEPRAGRLLEEVWTHGLFVSESDRGGGWWRYHDVFKATLRAELERREPDLLPDLHRRAAAWYEASGSQERALEHAIAAGDGALAGSLLAGSWMDLVGGRRHVTLRRLLDRLPPDRGASQPLCRALDLLCMIYEGVDQRVTAERAARLAAEHGTDPQVQLVVDGILATPFYGEVGKALATAREAWLRWAEVPDAEARLAVQLALLLWFAGEAEEVRGLLEPRVRLTQPPFPRIWTLGILALVAADEGDPEMAERYAREARAGVVAAGAETATEFSGLPWAMAEALRVAGRLEEARTEMDQGLENEASRPGSVGHAVALVFDASLALAEGEVPRAARSAARARAIVDRYPDLGAVPDRLGAVESALAAGVDEPLRGSPLSAAEMRVLVLLDGPRSLADIAAELYLSRDTVKSHTRRIYRRLGVNSREAAVAAARARGLLAGS